MSAIDTTQLIDPRYGKVVAESWPSEASRTLLILGHEYVVPTQQRSVYLQLESILERQPAIPILIEGWTGGRKPSRSAIIENPRKRVARALQILEKKGQLASDVIGQLYPSGGRVHGIDNVDLESAQQEKLSVIDTTIQSALSEVGETSMPSKDFLQGSFDMFSSILRDLEKGALNSHLSNLLSIHEQFTEDLKLVPYVKALIPIASKAGIDIDAGYPSIGALARASKMEDRLNFDEVEQSRLELVEELSLQADIPLSGQRARAIERWIETAPDEEDVLLAQYGDVLGERLAQPSSWIKRLLRLAPPPQEAPHPSWLVRLVALSLGLRDRQISQARYYTRLNDLMKSLEIKVPASSPLHKYIDYMLLTDSINVYQVTTVDLPALLTELSDLLVSSAKEYGILRLRQQLNDLSQLVELKLPAAKVRSVLAHNPSIVQWLADVLRLGENILDDRWINSASQKQLRKPASRCAKIIEKLLPDVQDYYFYACRRSYELMHKTLRHDFGETSTAVLVCGRFYLYEILRTLRHDRRFSWALVVPGRDGEDDQKKYQSWQWAFGDEEFTHT